MSKLDQILADLPDNDAAELRATLASAVPHTEVAAILSRHVMSVSETAVRRWRQANL